MIIYLHSKCSTCQKALQFLEGKQKKVIVRDIVKKPPSFEELEKMLGFYKGNLTKLLNTSGQLYRDMQLTNKIKEMGLSEVLSLLSSQGMLVKRPFLLGEDFGLIGFKEEEWNRKLQ